MDGHEIHSHSFHPDLKQDREHRSRTFKSGIISYQDFRVSMNCIVKDMSAHGAKLKISGNENIPDRITLTIPMDSTSVDCFVRYRSASLIGVQFLSDVRKDTRFANEQHVDVDLIIGKRNSLRKNI